VRQDGHVAPGTVELPPGLAAEFGEATIVVASAVQRDGSGTTLSREERLLVPRVRSSARPPGAVLHASTAQDLGAVAEQYVRIRLPSPGELRNADRVQSRPYVLGACATNAAVILALVLELNGWLKWAFAGATALATGLLTVLYVRAERQKRNFERRS
jgi:hypothetical protein